MISYCRLRATGPTGTTAPKIKMFWEVVISEPNWSPDIVATLMPAVSYSTSHVCKSTKRPAARQGCLRQPCRCQRPRCDNVPATPVHGCPAVQHGCLRHDARLGWPRCTAENAKFPTRDFATTEHCTPGAQYTKHYRVFLGSTTACDVRGYHNVPVSPPQTL